MDFTTASLPFIGRTQALRTNWCYHHPSRLLIDAGDGAAIDLGDRVGTPRRLCLTHAHSDHILGIPNLILARQLPSTVSGGPLDIYYPQSAPQIEALQKALSILWPYTVFDRISWHPIDSGYSIPLNANRAIASYATDHVKDALTLGYAVTESRTRLKAPFASLAQVDLNGIISSQGRAAVTETYTAVDFSHTGDTKASALDQPLVKEARTLIVDCTFLRATDKDYDTHASLEEALDVLSDAPITNLVLHHFSQRYDRRTLRADVGAITAAMPIKAQNIFLWDDTVVTSL